MPFDFSPYAAVLLDLDGTLYYEEHALPGAADLVRRLRAEGRPYACLTNSTSSPARIRTRLAHMGIDMPADRIWSAAAAAADYVLKTLGARQAVGTSVPLRPRVMNLATEGFHELLDSRVDWVNRADESCDAIVVGAPTNVFATPDRQRIAMEIARRTPAVLVGVCADRVYPSPRGMELGCGALTSMLAYAADVPPDRIVYTGKPEPIFFNELCAHLGVPPARCLLIGDNLESDIAGARRVGADTILVLTGVATEPDAQAAPENKRPGRVIPDLTALL
ncbi:MAG TPA: HAD-IIA family hydrolase [Tepidisphaeraceae bacterium]|nr:HAD-IIA family hydrolase [Tepidisphaeraceae bacterium]